jgi:hypothetical protein
MGIFKMLFGSPEVAVKTAGTLAKGVDSLIYTDEEKADARAKAMDWLGKYMEATQGQNIARRLIAVLVVIEWLLLINLGVALRLFSWLDESEYVFNVLDNLVKEPFMLIIGFYFLARIIPAAFGNKEPPKK